MLNSTAGIAQDRPTFLKAVQKARSGQQAAAIADLEQLVQYGDARAQLMLGLAYVGGTWVPRDKPRGLAWLQTAAEGSGAVAEQARRAIVELEPGFSGRELIEADQLTLAFAAQSEARLQGASAQAMQRLAEASAAGTRAASGGRDETVEGCALNPRHRDCPTVMRPDACQWPGQFPTPEVRARVDRRYRGASPQYPDDFGRLGWEGTVFVMAHVDRAGWVCRVTIVSSSGIAGLDAMALETARLMRFKPALIGGAPIEAVETISMSFVQPDSKYEFESQGAGR